MERLLNAPQKSGSNAATYFFSTNALFSLFVVNLFLECILLGLNNKAA